LINDPSGSFIQQSVELLQNSPFQDYLIPGILLLLAIGIPSIVAIVLTVRNSRHHPVAMIIEGSLLLIFLTAELVIHIDFFHPLLHIPCYIIGIILVVLGFVLQKS
jgi:hypothetical protein